MQKLTIKQYAIQHKLSIFNVIKLTKSGKVNIETVKEDDKEVVYILIDDVQEEVTKEIITKEQPKSLRVENLKLKKEILRLQEELEKCKQRK